MSIRTLSLVTLALAGLGHAQSKQFTVGDVEGRKVAQRFTVESDADFENFIGQTHRVSGWMKFDPTTKRGLGKLTVDLASIDTGIEMRNEHMRAEGWLNTTAFPKAVFETTQVEHKSGETFRVTGKLTLKGVTKTITTEATVKYLPESEATRKVFKGDVLRVRTSFPVKLSDYGVSVPERSKGKVAEVVTIRLDVFGVTG